MKKNNQNRVKFISYFEMELVLLILNLVHLHHLLKLSKLKKTTTVLRLLI